MKSDIYFMKHGNIISDIKLKRIYYDFYNALSY